MKKEKENLIRKSYRLPAAQVEIIDGLVAKRIYGNESDVVRALLGNAIKELIETDFVKKYLETKKLLGK